MRLQHELVPAEVTPSAGKSVLMLQEINGAIEFGAPSSLGYFTPSLVDQDQGTGLDQRIHHPILQANKGVAVLFQIKSVQKRQGKPAPSLNNPAKESGAAHIDAGIEGQRKLYLARPGGPESDHMCARDLDQAGVRRQFAQRHGVPFQYLRQIQTVYGAK